MDFAIWSRLLFWWLSVVNTDLRENIPRRNSIFNNEDDITWCLLSIEFQSLKSRKSEGRENKTTKYSIT